MRPICFLSMDDLGGYVSDDELAIEPLNELGFAVSTLSWRQTEIDWAHFEAVIIRTPWDYQRDPENFLAVLKSIERVTRLENPSSIVEWNLDKSYLPEMEDRGVAIVPSIFDVVYDEGRFSDWQNRLATKELIVKPLISATAEHTYRLTAYVRALESVFANRPFLVQPFLPTVITEGEYSLFYFNGEYSHAINKSPKAADFRVQEEHGGLITEIVPDEPLRKAAQKAVDQIGQDLLYARVDLIRDEDDKFVLMELELIEPALYLRMNAEAPRRFAAAIASLLN